MRLLHIAGAMAAGLATISFLGGVTAAWAQAAGNDADGRSWHFAGADIHNTRSAPDERRLGPEGAPRLAPKWIFKAAGDLSATPTVDHGVLYVPDWGGMLHGIDVKTGVPIWSRKVSEYTGNEKSLSRTSPAIGDRTIVFGDQGGATIIAVGKEKGDLVWKTVVDPLPGAWIASSPVIVGNRVYVGVSSNEEVLVATVPGYKLEFRGSIVALDLETGAVVWRHYTVPEGYTGGAIVGGNLAIDEKRNSLYAGAGNNYSVPPDVTTCLKGKETAEEQAACLDPLDHVDAVLSLDLTDGHLKWSARTEGFDTWTGSCRRNLPGCPDPVGPDYDFASAPNLFTTKRSAEHEPRDILGIGQKSGIYWAFDPDNGSVIWATRVGPGGPLGGIEWGSAVDGDRIYVAIADVLHKPYKLSPSGQPWHSGSWAALDPATGGILWQIPTMGNDPAHPKVGSLGIGSVSVANGVMYAGTNAGDMAAIDGATGKVLWQFASGGTVISGPAIVDGALYWGSGYSRFDGIPNNQLYAFAVPE
jgi:polyvinyl alcohol dehydrogenase (cytochrome)